MKKLVTLVLVGMVMAFAFTACKSSKGGNCDAYGSADHIENSDLAAK